DRIVVRRSADPGPVGRGKITAHGLHILPEARQPAPSRRSSANDPAPPWTDRSRAGTFALIRGRAIPPDQPQGSRVESPIQVPASAPGRDLLRFVGIGAALHVAVALVVVVLIKPLVAIGGSGIVIAWDIVVPLLANLSVLTLGGWLILTGMARGWAP